MDDITPIKQDLTKDIEMLETMKKIEKSKNMHSVKIGNKTVVSYSSKSLLEENLAKLNKIYKKDL